MPRSRRPHRTALLAGPVLVLALACPFPAGASPAGLSPAAGTLQPLRQEDGRSAGRDFRRDALRKNREENWRLAARLALLEGVRQALGKPYAWGASGPGAFDCSGLVLWLYGRIGVRLPRIAVEQGSVGIAVPDRLRFGDVLLFRRRGPGWHVGLYLARGRFVHAEGRGRGVAVSSLASAGYASRLCRARRYLR